MRFTRAIDKETGKFVEQQDARAKTEQTRYSHIFNCLNLECGCTYHWRKAVGKNENTERIPPTFVKNRSSSHIDKCKYDYAGFVRQHRDVAYEKDDHLNLRVQFPLGAAAADLYPGMSGILSHRQKQAAQNNVSKMGFQSLRNLVDFVEKNMGGLNDPIMNDLRLHYQGEPEEWNGLWVSATDYSKLLDKSKEVDSSKRNSSALTLVKPDHLGVKNGKDKWRFICQEQTTVHDGKEIKVRPILVCSEYGMAANLIQVAKNNEPVLVASRPFVPEEKFPSDIKNVYLSVAKIEQLARVKPQYWKPVLQKENQMCLELPALRA